MSKKTEPTFVKNIILVLILTSIFTSLVFLTGCSAAQKNQTSNTQEGLNTGQPPLARGGGGMNLTPEQRQQMINERMQQAADACQGKAEGDNCTLQSQRGNMTVTGSCKIQNESLACMPAGGQFQGQYHGNYTNNYSGRNYSGRYPRG